MTSPNLRNELSLCLARLWRYAMVLSKKRDVADDLVQATCVRALERAQQIKEGSPIDRWFFSILHSIWINEVRAQQVRRGQGFVDIDELNATPVEFDNQRQANQVMQRVNQLPEAQRNAVFLVYVEGFTYQEAAQTLDVPVGTIMSRLASARLTLAGKSAAASHRGRTS
ncbi:RNA polymerase sigma factor [Rouxiella badensis]|uniref:RNA polymerase subunit sigma-24 n=2 Tax=Rouxiella badensis TaxID=1646377 RepID=A0A1X0WBW2_9GAMM|nr:RNA polymerase sigma factor [Rouxiella badensis]MCC3720166.1 RNA polymerase sigma factor [Rouxiella badensis]MCC3729829.1 RNA polymerase sigma factor [Rouxiella badensis]MCC3733987.1 RNA polymerase sigma factor [Rouxiella badensis]MCC3741316.1 RNA polymerase sigma factor [Rouxiella badensis]MCC3748328.1 RNA polymerase sigma factor [Rouxiella badensis]